MVPVVIKLWHQRYLFLRVRPKGHTKSHVQLSAASRWDSRSPSSIVSMSGYQLINKPAPLGLKTLGPGPCSWPPNVQLTTKRAVDHQTCSLPPNAGQARRRFCSSSRPIRTLEVCGRISYCFYYVNFGIVWCYGYDKIVFYAYYFIFSVYCFLGWKIMKWFLVVLV